MFHVPAGIVAYLLPQLLSCIAVNYNNLKITIAILNTSSQLLSDKTIKRTDFVAVPFLAAYQRLHENATTKLCEPMLLLECQLFREEKQQNQ